MPVHPMASLSRPPLVVLCVETRNGRIDMLPVYPVRGGPFLFVFPCFRFLFAFSHDPLHVWCTDGRSSEPGRRLLRAPRDGGRRRIADALCGSVSAVLPGGPAPTRSTADVPAKSCGGAVSLPSWILSRPGRVILDEPPPPVMTPLYFPRHAFRPLFAPS